MSIAYCKQVPPEYQQSPLMWDDMWPDDLALMGNRNYTEHIPDVVKQVIDDWEYAYDDMEEFRDTPIDSRFESLRELINDTFPPFNRAEYSDAELEEWCDALQYLSACDIDDMDEGYCRALTLYTGHTWYTSSISGSCQGDWQNILYDSEAWSDEALEQFECDYFNTGEEWVIYEGNGTPDCPADIDDDTVYIRGYDSAEELKELLGVDKVVMYRPYEVRDWHYTKEEA